MSSSDSESELFTLKDKYEAIKLLFSEKSGESREVQLAWVFMVLDNDFFLQTVH